MTLLALVWVTSASREPRKPFRLRGGLRAQSRRRPSPSFCDQGRTGREGPFPAPSALPLTSRTRNPAFGGTRKRRVAPTQKVEVGKILKDESDCHPTTIEPINHQTIKRFRVGRKPVFVSGQRPAFVSRGVGCEASRQRPCQKATSLLGGFPARPCQEANGFLAPRFRGCASAPPNGVSHACMFN